MKKTRRWLEVLAWISMALLAAGTVLGGAAFLSADRRLLNDATFVVAAAGAMIALSQLGLLRHQMDEENLRRHRERSFSFTLVHQPHLREARSHIEKFFRTEIQRSLPVSSQRLDRVFRGEERSSDGKEFEPIMLKHLLAHWEHLAMTIYCNATDEDVAFEAVGSVLVDHVAVFKNYIATAHLENPRSYVYLVHLAARWQQRLQRPLPPVFVPLSEQLDATARHHFLMDLRSPLEGRLPHDSTRVNEELE
jgi:hypothetical protein